MKLTAKQIRTKVLINTFVQWLGFCASGLITDSRRVLDLDFFLDRGDGHFDSNFGSVFKAEAQGGL